MKKIYLIPVFILLLLVSGCGHPRDKTHLDDIIHCSFGQEYVDGYTKKNGTSVDGYCRNSN